MDGGGCSIKREAAFRRCYYWPVRPHRTPRPHSLQPHPTLTFLRPPAAFPMALRGPLVLLLALLLLGAHVSAQGDDEDPPACEQDKLKG